MYPTYAWATVTSSNSSTFWPRGATLTQNTIVVVGGLASYFGFGVNEPVGQFKMTGPLTKDDPSGERSGTTFALPLPRTKEKAAGVGRYGNRCVDAPAYILR